MDEYEATFIRAVVQILFYLLLMRHRAKEYLWDTVPTEQTFRLVTRIIQRVISTFFMMYSIKYLPVGIVSLIANTAPLFIAIFGYLMLRERITILETFCLMLAFSGVLVLVLSGN